jgi:FdhD protein/phenylacetyl-CoA:acceptor oxidoreductase accessory protein
MIQKSCTHKGISVSYQKTGSKPEEETLMHGTAGGEFAAHQTYAARRCEGATVSSAEEVLAEEVPVALVYNGISHAVMLASPTDLEDFAVGFSLSECIVGRAGEVLDLEILPGPDGIEIQMRLTAERAEALKRHRRSLAGRTGCGLCGAESLQQVAPRMSRVAPAVARLDSAAIGRALAGLRQRQSLFELTGAVHAAAWCDAEGRIQLLREDVGRHNALDKLVGAVAGQGSSFGAGFVVLTSRASYEMVQKAAAAGIAVVAAVSAPTGMAVRSALDAGVTLVGFARGEKHCVYTHPERFH